MHVRIDGGAIRSEELYGKELAEQTAAKVLGNSPDRGKLFMPGITFYTITDDTSLNSAAHEIFRWFGFKPRHITVSFGELSTPVSFEAQASSNKLVINQYFKNYPLIAAALLCHGVVHYLVDARYHAGLRDEQANESLINYLAIEAGLGLVLLNGLGFQSKIRKRITDLLQPQYSLQEIFPKPTEIVADFEQFVADHRLHYEDYAAHLAPWTRRYLPIGLQPLASYRDQEPLHISMILKNQRRRRTYLILALITILLTAGLLKALQRPTPMILSNDQLQQQAKIQDLYTKMQECERAVALHRSNIDRSDLNALRVIDSEQANCASMRNYYDYQRGQFEQGLRENN
jgi:hypothetical protein